MINSIMKNNWVKKTLLSLAILLFWLGVWYLAAFFVDSSLLLPTPHETLSALIALVCTLEFYEVVFYTLIRVLLGLVIGVAVGIILAVLCHRFKVLRDVINPIISVIRATPVATFIVLLWVLVSGNSLTVLVAFLMVMPIVWQNALDAFGSIPKDLVEVADVYNLSYKRRFEVLVLPVLSRYIYPAVITSVGLSWKSEIAAEIIAYTKNSIGMHINDAKFYMNTSAVFAWTAVIVVMSIALEFLTKWLLGRSQK